jgi:succinate dehydrogenase/fumarate reductase-like Fe-S protein
MTDELTLRVQRRNPQTDSDSRLQTYRIPTSLTVGMTLVNALKYIQETIDPSLAFYYSCELAKCRGCVIEADGLPVFACTEPVRDGLTLAPLSGLPVLRDLVVKFLSAEVFLDAENCIGCETCLTVCPMDVYEMSAEGDKAVIRTGPIRGTAAGHEIDCIGCRRCESHCGAGAIRVECREPQEARGTGTVAEDV